MQLRQGQDMQPSGSVTISKQTLYLAVVVVLLLVAVAVLATLLLTGGDTRRTDAGALAWDVTPTLPPPWELTSTSSPTATLTPDALETVVATVLAQSSSPTAATLTGSPTSVPAATLAPPSPTAAPVIQPPPADPPPTATSPPPTPTTQVSTSPSNDYIKVLSRDYSGGQAATLTVEYQAYPRPGGQFYISATAWRTGAGTTWCGATAATNIPRNFGSVSIAFPWAEMPTGCTPATFSSIYACLAFDGKETVCVNVYE